MPTPADPTTVRPGRPSDAPALARLFTASRRAAMPWLREVHGPEATEAWLREVVLAHATVLVAEAGGAPVAFVAFTAREVQHLYVAPEARGRGLGARLLAEAMAGAAALELWVFQRNQAARAFYARHGFRLVEETDGTRNEEREPDARYRWERSAKSS